MKNDHDNDNDNVNDIKQYSNGGYQDSLLLLSFFLLRYFAQKKHTRFIQMSQYT